MSIVFTSFKHPKLPICIKIPVTLLQIDSYISKFKLINYLFANLLVVLLYLIAPQTTFNYGSIHHEPRPDYSLWSSLIRDHIVWDIGYLKYI